MNNNYIKLNNLGLLVESSQNEVSQGNHNVDIYHIGYDIYDYTNSYATVVYTLPDGTNSQEFDTSFKDFEFNGSEYKGFMFKLSQTLTAQHGVLNATINLYSNNDDTRLCSYRLKITIHKTDYAEKPTITEEQYHSLLEVMHDNYNELRTMIEELRNR
jgi:hypothetical protein